jgi:hypothetical protein
MSTECILDFWAGYVSGGMENEIFEERKNADAFGPYDSIVFMFQCSQKWLCIVAVHSNAVLS